MKKLKNLKASRKALFALIVVVAIVAIGAVLGSLFFNELIFGMVGILSVSITSIYRYCTIKELSKMQFFEMITIGSFGAIIGTVRMQLWSAVVVAVIAMALIGLFIFVLTGEEKETEKKEKK